MEDFTKEEKLQQSMRLKNSRRIIGLSVEEFSEQIGISVSGYQKVENGQNAISRKLLRNIWKKFNISADFILYGEYKEITEILAAVHGCRDEDKMELLLHLVKYFVRKKDGVANREINNQELSRRFRPWIEAAGKED